MGLATPTSDDDLFRVVIPPAECFFGLDGFKPSRHTIAKKMGGQWDTHEITLARLVQSIIAGRTTDVEPLFGNFENMEFSSEPFRASDIGRQLLELRPEMLSQKMFKPLLGMAQSQLKLAFKGNTDRYRDDLGYDPKAAAHCARSLWQAIRLKRDGVFFMKFKKEDSGFRNSVMQIKLGEMPLKEVISGLEELETYFQGIDTCHEAVPETVDEQMWKLWLSEIQRNHLIG